jgi:hypothetical protein
MFVGYIVVHLKFFRPYEGFSRELLIVTDLGPVSHGRTVSFTGIRLLAFGYYEYQYLYASNRFNLSVSQNLNTQ